MGTPFSKEYLDSFIGKRQGQIVVLSHFKKGKNNSNYFRCQCDCGRIAEIRVDHFFNDKQTTCGTFHKKYENSVIGNKIYNTWNRMINRCYNPKSHKYYRYGKRGISVCKDWLNNYDNFYIWCINNGYKEGLSLDRINNDGNYEPSNCRWTTRKQQQRNMCRNRIITYKNQTHCLAEWCERLNLKYETIKSRLNKGWSIERAFEEPIVSR
jgi:hypothetical protein